MDQLVLPHPDPFADDEAHPATKIHIRNQQRNGRKCLTLIEGLPADLDIKRILSAMRKPFNVNGTVLNGQVLQLQGDVRERAKEFLVKTHAVPGADAIVVHGA